MQSGIQLWRALRKIECDASRAAEAYCTGEPFKLYRGRGEPLVLNFREEGYHAWERFVPIITERVRKVLGQLPRGFFVNGDPRGYALKLDPEGWTLPEGMHRDWGRYGILAPVID